MGIWTHTWRRKSPRTQGGHTVSFIQLDTVVFDILTTLSIWEAQWLRRQAWQDTALVRLADALTGGFKIKSQVAAATGKAAGIGRVSKLIMKYRDGLGQLELTGERNNPPYVRFYYISKLGLFL